MRRCWLPLMLNAALAFAQDVPRTLMDKGHFKRARPLVEQRYRENPKDAETLWLLSRVKQEWKDTGAAIDLAEKAVAADPRNPRYHLRLADAVGEEASRAGKLRQFGLGRRFRKEVEATLALDPNNVEALFMQMEFQIQAPSIMGGDKANARRIADRIMRIDPVHGYFAQVRLARLDKRTDSIEGLYRKAVEIRPSDYEALLQLGYFLGTSKKFAESEARAREAIRVDPDRVEAHGLLAAALVQQKKWTELDRALPESERAVPDNLMPLYRAAADCVLTNVEIARAEQLLRRYLGQEPEPNMPGHADAHLWLGRALEKQGRKAEAVAEYHTALRMDPNSPAKQDLKRLK